MVGVIALSDRFDLGSRIIQGAKDLGETIGKTVTGIPTGIVTGGAAGSGEEEKAGKTGADFQETIFGNRDFFGDLFGGLFNPLPPAAVETPGLDPNQPDPTSNPNGIRGAFAQTIDFSKILNSINPIKNKTFTFNQPQSIGTTRDVGLSLTGARGVVDTLNALGVRGKILPVNAVGRTQPTLQGTITTVAVEPVQYLEVLHCLTDFKRMLIDDSHVIM